MPSVGCEDCRYGDAGVLVGVVLMRIGCHSIYSNSLEMKQLVLGQISQSRRRGIGRSVSTNPNCH